MLIIKNVANRTILHDFDKARLDTIGRLNKLLYSIAQVNWMIRVLWHAIQVLSFIMAKEITGYIWGRNANNTNEEIDTCI